jgi:hypothetical protein
MYEREEAEREKEFFFFCVVFLSIFLRHRSVVYELSSSFFLSLFEKNPRGKEEEEEEE